MQQPASVQQYYKAIADKRPIFISGNQSTWGELAQQRHTVIDTSQTSYAAICTRDNVGIIEYEPSEMVIRVRAGTLIADINATLVQSQQMLGFEPATHSGKATIGGAVAVGNSGAARPYYGACRDFVLGVGMVTGEGQFCNFGGQVMKNVAGFDVAKLLVGSHGLLGLIHDISLRVLPLLPVTTTISINLTAAQAIGVMNLLAGIQLPINAQIWHAHTLYIRLHNHGEVVEKSIAAIQAAINTWQQQHADITGDLEVTAADNNIWDLVKEDALLPQTALLRVVCPQNAPVVGSPLLIDWAGGLRLYAASAGVGLAQQTNHTVWLWKNHRLLCDIQSPMSPEIQKINTNLRAVFDPYALIHQRLRF